MAGKAVAIDRGSHSTRVLAVKDGKTGLALTQYASFPSKQDAQGLVASGIPLKGVAAGLAGRDMTLRYTQVPPSPDWQLRNLMELEIQELSNQSGDELSADYNLLPALDEEADSETVLMALARNEALERVASVVSEAGGSVAAHVPNCIAIYNAYLRAGPVEEDTVVCLTNIGHETMDIALVKGVDLLFARNLSGGGKVLDDAITAAFNVSSRKAESLKKELLDLDPQSRGRFASGQAEKVTMAAGGSSNMLSSAIQSSLAFCKSQTGIADLQLDKILLCGGSARIRGIRGRLREDLRCPVELFDPFENVDLSALSPQELEELDQNRYESVAALGLAAGACDDSLYSLEILPEAVKRRQRFLQRTIYNIGAGLVAAALLGLFASAEKAELAQKEVYASKQTRRANGVTRVHNRAEVLVELNQKRKAVADLLVEKSLPLDGLVNVMRALQEHMEPEFWIKSIKMGNKSRLPGRGRSSRSSHPVILVEALGKEGLGRRVNEACRQMVLKLKQLDYAGTVTQLKDRQMGDRTTFTLEFDFLGKAKEQIAPKPDADPDADPKEDN